MNTILKLSLLVALVFNISACKKNQVGGKSSVSGNVNHHGKAIADAFVYIKFNATEFPGEEYKNYDTYVKTDASGNYRISLYKGSYYLYATGTDIAIPPPYVVKGGTSFSIKNKETISRDIAVSED